MSSFLSKVLLKFYFGFKFVKTVILTSFFRCVFKKFGSESVVKGSIVFYCPNNIEVGNDCTINEGVMLNANKGSIIIGDHVRLSPFVMINTTNLDLSLPYTSRTHIGKSIRIGDGVWIGTNAIINPGVCIGEGSVVGAGSVVTKDVEAHCLVAGVPAKKIKDLPKHFPDGE